MPTEHSVDETGRFLYQQHSNTQGAHAGYTREDFRTQYKLCHMETVKLHHTAAVDTELHHREAIELHSDGSINAVTVTVPVITLQQVTTLDITIHN